MEAGQHTRRQRNLYSAILCCLLIFSNFKTPSAQTFTTSGWDFTDDVETTTDALSQETHPEDPTLLSGNDHPCHRPCVVGAEPMICHYYFMMEWYQTMSKACYDCPYVESDCNRKDCVPADGMNRPISVVNRMMPGPSIEICVGDRVVVDIKNELMVEGTSLHWHGQQQHGTPYMDGTPYVTQCPIMPQTTFRYQFDANHTGSHFWHSHSGMQRADGAAGAFIVRQPLERDRHAKLYDYDLSEHIMVVTDWVHALSISSFTDHHHSSGDNKPPSLLVNGRGRFAQFERNATGSANQKNYFYMKAARFDVEHGYRYRFRIINAEFLNCPIEISIDNHTMTIIQSDGFDIEPLEATSLVTYAGERFDIIITADQEQDNYWIRLRGLMDCDSRFTAAGQVAVLHYDGALETEPPGEPGWEELHNEGVQVNALNEGTESPDSVSIPELTALDADDISLKPQADMQFYIAYDFYAKNNTHFHKAPHYGYNQVPEQVNRLYTPQLNHISMKLPSSPPLLARPSASAFCNGSSVAPTCRRDYCECEHVLVVPLGAVVELVLVDEGVTFNANHPFHLHGHAFRVVSMRRVSNETTVEEVQALDAAGQIHRKLHGAPLKDTVTVPDGGYTIIRWLANNPGYWLFHCHIEFHVEVGMSLVFKVGEHKDMAPIPRNFPTCGDWTPDNGVEHETPESDKAVTGPVISITHWWPLIYMNGTSAATSATVNPQLLATSISAVMFFQWAAQIAGGLRQAVYWMKV